MNIEIVVHPERCMSTGRCRTVAPDVFGIGEGGWVRLLQSRPAQDRLEAVLEASEECPLAAIDVEVSEGR